MSDHHSGCADDTDDTPTRDKRDISFEVPVHFDKWVPVPSYVGRPCRIWGSNLVHTGRIRYQRVPVYRSLNLDLFALQTRDPS